MLVGLGHTHHEGRTGHIGVDLLNHQPLGTLALVLVGTPAVHLVLPRLFAGKVLSIAPADVGHDVVDGSADAVLTGTGARHQHVHQRGLVLHVVDVAEASLAQMGAESREHRVADGRLVDVGRLRGEQLDELRKLARHNWSHGPPVVPRGGHDSIGGCCVPVF